MYGYIGYTDRCFSAGRGFMFLFDLTMLAVAGQSIGKAANIVVLKLLENIKYKFPYTYFLDRALGECFYSSHEMALPSCREMHEGTTPICHMCTSYCTQIFVRSEERRVGKGV